MPEVVSHVSCSYGKVFIFMHLGLRPSAGVASKSIRTRWHWPMANLIIAQEYSRTVDIGSIKDEQNRLQRPREMAIEVCH